VARHYRWWAAAVALLMAANVFAGLAWARIDDMDEARYGVAAYEMLHSKQWLVPTYAGATETWNLKPPLGYWMLAGSFALFGATPFALRLPSALCALAALGVLMAYARRAFGRRVAVLSGAILATSYGFFCHHGARSGDLDAALTALVCGFLLVLLGGLQSFAACLAAGVLLGAIFLLKSFAVLPVLAVAFVFLLFVERPRAQARQIVVMLLPLLVVATAWAALRWVADGSPWFLLRMAREDLVQRSTQVIDKGTYERLGYAGPLLDRLAPWSVLAAPIGVIAWLRRRRGWRPTRALSLTVCWSGIPFVLFSLAKTQHHWYMDPVYPACAVLTALAVLYALRGVRLVRRPWALAALALLPLAGGETRVVGRAFGRDRMPPDQQFLVSLGAWRAQHGPKLAASFPLRHSERFLLEVVDGFEVREEALNPLPVGGPLARDPSYALYDGGAGLPLRLEPVGGEPARRAAEALQRIDGEDSNDNDAKKDTGTP
jgi:4-amino-4-deoxy-L-arabinose transferase-like glycosyltransferase